MNVLFVCSGNSKYADISPFTKAQGESLKMKGINVSYYQIKGKGVINYLRNAFYLKKMIRQNTYDIMHAHYSLSGWVAVLASRKIPVVLSLMGDDAQGTFTGKQKVKLSSRFFIMLTYLVQPFVKAIISKSEGLAKAVYRKKISYVIPNGVQLNKFIASESDFRSELGLKKEKKYVLFLADPEDANKNYALAKEAVRLLGRDDVELLNIYGTPQGQVIKYLNSVDVFVSCSFAEGSANVIKEAMACNCPMVVTDAGDASWVIGDTPGCFVSSFDPGLFARDLDLALEYAVKFRRTKGRKRICELGLDAESVSEKIAGVYRSVLSN